MKISFKNGAIKAVVEKSSSWKLVLATFFGTGLFPKAPGTVGSLAAMGILLLPEHLVFPGLFASILFFSLLSIISISAAEEEWGSDAGCIVIDEAVGMWIVLLHPATHSSVVWALGAFALFRIFDIWKPFPIRALNNKKGAFFVLADDILAGIFAFLFLHLVQLSFF